MAPRGGGTTAGGSREGPDRRLNEAARADLLGNQYAVRAVQLELISAVASTYFELLEYRTDLDISQRTYALRDSMYLIIDARFRAGIAAEIDLAEVAAARRKIPNLRNAREFHIKDPVTVRSAVA